MPPWEKYQRAPEEVMPQLADLLRDPNDIPPPPPISPPPELLEPTSVPLPEALPPQAPWLKYKPIESEKPTLATKIETKEPTIVDRAGAALLGAGQGASFGFGDEALAALTTAGTLPITGAIATANKLGADIPNPMADKSIEDVYNEQLGANRAQLTKAAEETPVEYIGGNIAGAISGGVGTAGTKGATMLANSLRSGNLAARIGKGALAGAASGGVYGFGAGEGGAEKRLESAGDSALVGGVVGGAAPVVASVVKNVAKGAQRTAQGAVARGADELEAATQAMRQESSANYAAMRQANAFINKPRAINIANKSEAAMNSVGKINKRLHGDTLSVLGDFKKAINNNNTTIEELDQFRQLFGQVVTKNTSKLDGANPDALMAREIIESIDDSVDNLSPIDIKGGSTKAVDSLLKARAGYAKMKKFDSVARIIRDSEGDANYVKRELNKFIKDARKTRGWTKDELTALNEAGKLGAGEAVLKVLGKLGFDPSRIGSGVGAMFGSGAGAVLGGTAGGVAVPAVGTAARYAQKGLVRGQAENLLKTIESGAGKSAKLPPVNLPVTQASGAVGTSTAQPLKITIRPNLKTTIKNNTERLPRSEYLNQPKAPSVEELKKLSRVESVPVSQVRSTQTELDMKKFSEGKFAEDMFKGYGDKPVAVKLNNGEYLVFDGHHRATKALRDGTKKVDMHVIDAKDFDPVNAGRAASKPSMTDDELLRELTSPNLKTKIKKKD